VVIPIPQARKDDRGSALDVSYKFLSRGYGFGSIFQTGAIR